MVRPSLTDTRLGNVCAQFQGAPPARDEPDLRGAVFPRRGDRAFGGSPSLRRMSPGRLPALQARVDHRQPRARHRSSARMASSSQLRRDHSGPDRCPRPHRADVGRLPDGAFVAGAEPNSAVLVWRGSLWAWSPEGYTRTEPGVARAGHRPRSALNGQCDRRRLHSDGARDSRQLRPRVFVDMTPGCLPSVHCRHFSPSFLYMSPSAFRTMMFARSSPSSACSAFMSRNKNAERV